MCLEKILLQKKMENMVKKEDVVISIKEKEENVIGLEDPSFSIKLNKF